MEVYAIRCLFQTMLQGFSLGGCICKKRYVISRVHIHKCLCGISPASCFVGQQTWTYLQQLCTNTKCNIEGLPEAIDDIDESGERVREIHGSCTTWWRWWYAFKKTFLIDNSHLFAHSYMVSSIPIQFQWLYRFKKSFLLDNSCLIAHRYMVSTDK